MAYVVYPTYRLFLIFQGSGVKTVLIVDDNPAIRAAVRARFDGSTEMQICGEAADGLAAIKEAEEKKPDLIIMDLSMPGMNGAEVAAVLKNMMPEVRIVIFSLYSDLIGKSMARAVGVDLVLSKWDGVTGLTEALRPLLTDRASREQAAGNYNSWNTARSAQKRPPANRPALFS